LPIVTAVQAAKIIYFSIQDHDVLTKYRCTKNEFAVVVALDVTLLIIIISTSAKMIRWDHRNRDVSMCFLFQSYLSCAVIFAGIYMDFQAVATSANIPFVPTTNRSLKERPYPTVVLEFIHFAFATQTAMGQTGNIQPNGVMAYILIMIQMGQSFIFHTYIFGLGLLKIRTSRLSPRGKQRFLLAMSRADGSLRILNEPLLYEDGPSGANEGPESSENGSYYPFFVGGSGTKEESIQVLDGLRESAPGSGVFFSADMVHKIRSLYD